MSCAERRSGPAAGGANVTGDCIPSGMSPMVLDRRSRAPPVTLRNVDTGVSEKFTTHETGDYVFVNVIPGNYELEFQAAGFKTVNSRGLNVQVEQTLRQDIRLDPGTVTESVSVTDQTQMLQTEDAEIGGVISQQLVDALPIERSSGEIQLVGTGGTTSILARIENRLDRFDRERIEATRSASSRSSRTGKSCGGCRWPSARISPACPNCART